MPLRMGETDTIRGVWLGGMKIVWTYPLATLVPGAGDCAPYAEAIDDAVSNRKASEGPP